MHEPDFFHGAGVRTGALLHHLDVARHRASWPTVTAVIPTLNEAANLRWLLPRLAGVDEVVVVDGESADGTADVARRLRPDAVVISQPPAGKGAAMRAGFRAATSDVIVAIDADGSMDPREIDAFVALICCGFDVVKGSRYCVGGGSDDLTLLRRAGNLWLTRLANVLYGVRWTDLCYGYIALRRSVVDRLDLAADGFEIETELCVNAVTTGLRIAEVPSHELDRRSGVSKLNAARDGLRVLRTMVQGRRGPANRSRPRTVPRGPLASERTALERTARERAALEQVHLEEAPG
ncbi:glycosyltransferase family 2 protein [Actinoallomurus sp. NPDC052308]|uniref:glycosyltransferase family 2 protein n=1 Tax=Actinoallomurus sp. NPDC052308 TaxID=3155530 RepID=UPI00342C5B63